MASASLERIQKGIPKFTELISKQQQTHTN